MNALVVLDHPRRDSFSGAVADALMAGLAEAGHAAELADLYREGFDPRMPMADEPDWADADKTYSEATRAEMARIERSDAVVMVFPVWWWSLPAMSKGWIDRVWNHGWAYGARTVPIGKALMIGVAGADETAYLKRGYDQAMLTQLATGILDFCGVPESRLEVFYDIFAGGETLERHLARARELGREFGEPATLAARSRA